MPGFWQMNAEAAAGSASSVSQAATGAAGGTQIRCRSVTFSLAGPGAGTARAVVRDGATGVGAIIWTSTLSIAANGYAAVTAQGLDLRASPGNALTCEFVAGVATSTEDVSAQGDYVPVGFAMGKIE